MITFNTRLGKKIITLVSVMIVGIFAQFIGAGFYNGAGISKANASPLLIPIKAIARQDKELLKGDIEKAIPIVKVGYRFRRGHSRGHRRFRRGRLRIHFGRRHRSHRNYVTWNRRHRCGRRYGNYNRYSNRCYRRVRHVRRHHSIRRHRFVRRHHLSHRRHRKWRRHFRIRVRHW